MVASRRIASRLRQRAARVLALFVATLFVTLVAPLVQAQTYERLCSVRGDRYVVVDAQGMPVDERDASHRGAHCPLCLPASPPPVAFDWTSPPVRPDVTPHARAERAHIAALVGAPFPPRAPPLVS